MGQASPVAFQCVMPDLLGGNHRFLGRDSVQSHHRRQNNCNQVPAQGRSTLPHQQELLLRIQHLRIFSCNRKLSANVG